MTSTAKILILIVALMAASAIAFAGGYKTSAWHQQALQLTASRQQQKDAEVERVKEVQAQQQQDQANQKLIDAIAAGDAKTADAESAIFNKIEDQNHAFTKFQYHLDHAVVGTCSFGSGVGGLYSDAYQAAFSAGMPKADHPAEAKKTTQ